MNADERRFHFLPREAGEDKGGGLHDEPDSTYVERKRSTASAPSLTLPHFVGAGIGSQLRS